MTNKQQKISVYSHDCKAFVDEIKLLANILENQKLSNADVRAINCKICHDINNEITACMKLPGVKDYDDYEVINRGATSLCYLSKNDAQQKTILKVFEPESFPLTLITPYSDIEHDTVVSYNWIDCNKADAEQEYAFLKRFVRFILQEELITTLQSNANHNEQNLFIVPKLALTTKGFAFISPYFFGDTLKERFQKYAETTTSTTEGMICDSVRAVRQSAEYIRDVCHGKNIYHGDIKPSNFFDIKDGDSHLIKNIDFDTLVAFNENSFCVYRNWDVTATTPLFYYVDTARVNRNQDFDKIKDYDISALSRMLMYAIICIYGEEENLYNAFNGDSTHFNWIDFFFESSDVGERLFNDICIAGSTREGDYSEKIELSGLFIFEKIRTLLMRCSEKVKDTAMIVDAQEFIDCSLLIEELFKHNRGDFSMPSDTGREQLFILNGVIRHLNFLYLDTENNRNNKKITADYHKLIDLRPSLDWVQYVIEKNYYKQENEDYDKIDRHLIPDIDLGDGSEPLAYEFDDEGRSTTSSPLEQALNKVGDKSLFLIAEGGQGKTTTLRSFWLEFLSGRHDKPCFYVDLKMLDASDKDNAVHNYISNNKKGYSFSLCELWCRPLLLLDGANESDGELRKKNERLACPFVEECNNLIRKANYRIVIGSRSNYVGNTDKDDLGDNLSAGFIREFAKHDMQYISICKLRDTQIEHCLLGIYKEVRDKHSMINLLHNNMMLYIFMNLTKYRFHFEQNDINAGKLLNQYFEICFKVRYLRNILPESITGDDVIIYELIKRIERGECNKGNAIERNIYNELNAYKEIILYLIKNSVEGDFSVDEWQDKNLPFDILHKLALLKKIDESTYIWANEIYQEYFEALKLKNIFVQINQAADMSDADCFTNGLIQLSAHLSELPHVCDWPHIYRVYKYTGDIISLTQDQYDNLYEVVYNAMVSLYEKSTLTIYKFTPAESIALMEVLSIGVLPNTMTKVGCSFNQCDILEKVVVPDSVKEIIASMFKNCRNLNKLELSKSTKITPEETPGDIIYGCDNLQFIYLRDCYGSVIVQKKVDFVYDELCKMIDKRYKRKFSEKKFENLCMDVIESAMSFHSRSTRKMVINIAKEWASKAKEDLEKYGTQIMQRRSEIFTRVLSEFKSSTTHEVELLRKQLYDDDSDAFEETCMDVIKGIVMGDLKQDRSSAIEVARLYLQRTIDAYWRKIYERVVLEFEKATDAEYDSLKKALFN